jgi:hypothetical protein
VRLLRLDREFARSALRAMNLGGCIIVFDGRFGLVVLDRRSFAARVLQE